MPHHGSRSAEAVCDRGREQRTEGRADRKVRCRRRLPEYLVTLQPPGTQNHSPDAHGPERRSFRRRNRSRTNQSAAGARCVRQATGDGGLRRRPEPSLRHRVPHPSGSNPQFVYVANTDSIVRFPYQVGDLKARAAKESGRRRRVPRRRPLDRDLVFSPDGKKMLVGVGSRSTSTTRTTPAERIEPQSSSSTWTGRPALYASGIRNATGLAINPTTRQLWVCERERDNLGDNLVPDYVTHVEDGGFYGWP